MYCKYCGEQIDDNAQICMHCGCPTMNFETKKEEQDKRFNVFSLLGFIFSLLGLFWCFIAAILTPSRSFIIVILCSVTGFVLSIIGTVKSKRYKAGKAFGIAGIVISAITIISFISFIILIITLVISVGSFHHYI